MGLRDGSKFDAVRSEWSAGWVGPHDPVNAFDAIAIPNGPKSVLASKREEYVPLLLVPLEQNCANCGNRYHSVPGLRAVRRSNRVVQKQGENEFG